MPRSLLRGSLLLVFLRLGNLLGDHADGRVVQPEELSHFRQRVLVNAYGLVDLLVSRCLPCHVFEERLKGGSRCEPLMPRNLNRRELLVEERADPPSTKDPVKKIFSRPSPRLVMWWAVSVEELLRNSTNADGGSILAAQLC